jgi:hypothetical protein
MDRGARLRFPLGLRMVSFPSRPDGLWDPPSVIYSGYQRVMRQGREADHSPPTSAEVKQMWVYTATPIFLHGVFISQLVKHKNNFTFYVFLDVNVTVVTCWTCIAEGSALKFIRLPSTLIGSAWISSAFLSTYQANNHSSLMGTFHVVEAV